MKREDQHHQSVRASLFAAQPRLKDGEYSLLPLLNGVGHGVLFSSATHYVRIAAAASIPTTYSQTEVNPPHAQTILMRSSALMIFPNVLLVQRPIAQRRLLCVAMRRHSNDLSKQEVPGIEEISVYGKTNSSAFEGISVQSWSAETWGNSALSSALRWS